MYFPNTNEWYAIVCIRTDKGFIAYDCTGCGKNISKNCSLLESQIGVNAFLTKEDFKQALKKRKYTYEYKSPVELTQEVTETGYKAIIREIQKKK